MAMFEKLDWFEKVLVYKGLMALIESGKGDGFHNSDMGHAVYRAAAKGKEGVADYADGPERNTLFKMLSELSYDLSDKPHQIEIRVLGTWQEFCQFAVECYDKIHAPPGS